jgi:hypothetical protein
MLRAIAENNLFLRPILAMVGEENGLAQQGGAQLLVSGPEKAKR